MQEFIIKLKRRIEGKYFSKFESVFSWSGLDIDDFRTYVAGDSPKAINWKITAKLDTLFVNIAQEEKSVDLDIFLDINYNRKGETIAGHNAQLALNLFGDILVYAKKHLLPINLYLPWAIHQNIKQDFTVAYTFLHQFPQYLKKIPRRYQSSVPSFLQKAKAKKKKRAIVIFSDFLDIDEKDRRILKQLEKDHAVYLFRIPIDSTFGQNYEQKFKYNKISSCKMLGK